MTIDQMAERLVTIRELIADAEPLAISCDDGGSRVHLNLEDLKRLFTGRECEVSQYMGRDHYAVASNGCTFVAVGPLVSEPIQTVTL